jgi:glycosyltransferase involved in cell wall biosynthesis
VIIRRRSQPTIPSDPVRKDTRPEPTGAFSFASIIIPTCDDPRQLRWCLESLQYQTCYRFEVIIVDDGATIPVKDLAESYGAKYVYFGPETSLFRVAQARNLGVRCSVGDYIIFMDSDCIAPANLVETHLKYAQAETILYAKRYKYPRHLVRNFTPPLDYDALARDSYLENLSMNKMELNNHESMAGFNFSIAAQRYSDLGGHDEGAVDWGGEDTQFAKKHIEAGGYMRYLGDECALIHLDHSQRSIAPGWFDRFNTAPPEKYRRPQAPIERYWSVPERVDFQRIAIGVITYNALHKRDKTGEDVGLTGCLNAIHRFTDEPFDLIVCDDGSIDGTKDWCKANAIPCVSGANGGPAANKNRALAYMMECTAADVFLLLEVDTQPTMTGWQRVWAQAARKYSHVNWYNFQGHAETYEAEAGDGSAESAWFVRCFSAQVTATTRESIERVGYIDPRFRGYGAEHVEWTRRMAKVYRESWDCPPLTFPVLNHGTYADYTHGGFDPYQDKQNHILMRLMDNDPVYKSFARTQDEATRLKGELLEAAGGFVRVWAPPPLSRPIPGEEIQGNA